MRNGDLIDGTYQIINEIGQGGMGIVYLAYHTRLQKHVALKKIKSGFTNSTFLRSEADILKSLHHTYLPQVYDFMQNGSDVYTVIDYIDGCDLERHIKAGTVFDERQLLKWAKQLCEVLEYLHTREIPIIHSDIKPSNIIVTPSGDICLIDFNISLDGGEEVRGYSREYASPEQFYKAMLMVNNDPNAEYVNLDVRTDVYSLGATLYKLICGINPDAENGAYPLASMDLPYTEAFRELIDKSMCPETEKRFQSAAGMLRALQNLKKRDKRYKIYCLIQASSSIILCALCALGIYFCFFGARTIKTENYNEKYAELVRLCDAGEATAASRLCDEIIYNYGYFLKGNSPEVLSDIQNITGNCLYENGDYADAAAFYKAALDHVNTTENPAMLYQNYAVTLARQGGSTKLEALLRKADRAGIDTDKFLLLNAQLAFQEGNLEKALEFARLCAETEKTKSIKRSSLLLWAEICENQGSYQSAQEPLERALGIKQDANILRRMAACHAMSENYSDARDCYITLQREYALTFEDSVNLAKIYRISGNSVESISVLKKAETDYANDNRLFIIYIQLALVYDKAEYTEGQVRDCLFQARKAYDAAPDAARQKVDSGDFSLFRDLENKYAR